MGWHYKVTLSVQCHKLVPILLIQPIAAMCIRHLQGGFDLLFVAPLVEFRLTSQLVVSVLPKFHFLF